MKKSLLMVAAMLAAGIAFAEEGKKHEGGDKPHHPHPSFEKMDANGDGKVTLEEFKAAAPKEAAAEKVEGKFKKLDANGDGAITKEEMAAQKPHGDKGGDKGGDKK